MSTIQGFKLSPQQRRLWQLQQTGQGLPYRALCAIHCKGDLDFAALEAAFLQVADRHEILRTTFRRPSGLKLPLQVIENGKPPALSRHDLTGLPTPAQEREIERLLERLASVSPDLERGPLLRAVAVLSCRGWRLLIDLPCLCADAATLDHLAGELGRFYAGFESLAEEPFQYADIAEWQNELLETQEEVARKFWQERTVPGTFDFQLPFERPDSAEAFEPRRLMFRLGHDKALRLDSLASRLGAPPALVLLSCWQLLLLRLLDEPQMIIGTAYDGRRHDELRCALGPLTRYLPIVGESEPAAPFGDAVARLAKTWGDLFRWQELFDWTGLVQDGGEAPRFFPYCFEFHKLADRPADSGTRFSIDWWDVRSDRFRLKLSCLRTENGLQIALAYDAAAAPQAELERLAEWLKALLESAVERPQTPAGELEFLSEPERRHLLLDCTSTETWLDDGSTLSGLFEAQAARSPDRIALTFRGRTLTYAELDAWANRLAHLLLRWGVGPEVLVALCIERSLEMVVSILAILKVGGAWVPIDPGYPEERRRFMLEDSGAPVLLTSEALLARLPPGTQRVLCLDRDREEMAKEAPQSPGAGAAPENIAYVIYTSGSTGRPKAAMIPHSGIVNRLLWMQRTFPFTAADRLLQKTPYSFDASIWEIFSPLISGACLVIAEPGGHQDSSYLVEMMAREEITILQLVPSFLPVLLEEPELAAGCRTLRRLFCGGEALSGELARRFFALIHAELVNLYGPTETSIDATFEVCAPGQERRGITIGRPLSNVQVHILDRAMRLVPTGLPGGLFIGGAGLARGYLDRPDLTADRFVPDPWSVRQGGRLYRTGDLARRLDDGRIEFLGRIDQQVKIRGFRIELEEVESALGRLPSVVEAAAVAGEDASGVARLVAYVTVQRGSGTRPDELRDALARRLPEFMVPSVVVVMPALPRLPNGKLDRNALPEPSVETAEAKLLAGPRSPTEEVLSGLWAEVLGVERVGIDESFFALGGHSLGATRLISRVREAFQIEVRVSRLFEAPTVEAFAREVEKAQKAARGLEAPPIEQVLKDGPRPLSFAQQRLWFLQQLEPESSAYHLPGVLRLEGKLDVPALERAIGEIVRRHETLRTTFASAEGGAVQVIVPPRSVTIPRLDLTRLSAGQQRSRLESFVIEESRRPFDLAQGPLLRLALLHLGAQEHVLFFNMHHIVSDGWSVGIMVRELSELYGALVSGRAPLLPELRVQYADFACWQRQWLQGAVLETQLSYWRERLHDAPEVIALPTDRPRPAVQSYRGATCVARLPGGSGEGLLQISRTASATLFMTLLTAFKILLYRYGAGDDILVGTNIANRNRAEIENLIGFFVNALVLRTRLTGSPTVREALARVRETALGGFVHQDLPFDRLVEELQPRRDLAVTPLYQVVFEATQGDETPSLALPGLSIASLALPNTTAKFDLGVTVENRGGELAVAVEHGLDILDRTTVLRLLRHYETLLAGMVASPDAKIDDLPLLVESEMFQLLHELCGPERTYPLASLPRLFADQATVTPDRPAACCGDERIGYEELDRRANRLCALLRRLGAGPGHFVGLLEERGVGFLVSLLAILKSGAAYVPFEPTYPRDRIRWMLADSGVSILITRSELACGLWELLGESSTLGHLICLDASANIPLSEESTAPAIFTARDFEQLAGDGLRDPGDPGDPAYMLYTSGSTGLPKGAIIRHDGAVNHIYAQFEALELGADLCFLQTAPASSDISVWQFLAPVLIGGRTVIVDLETVSDPEKLLRILQDEQVSIVELVPAVLRTLLSFVNRLSAEKRSLPALRWIMATGEAVPVDLVNAWLMVYPEIPVVNAYGPTEASDDVTQWIIREPLPAALHSLPIGRPLANFDCHVMDKHLQLVPLGIPGELCIAGIGVGNGYWNSPRKTGERFVPNPFARTPGQALYRTGDLARRLPDGNLQFLGRIDHQVKIRGYRIELEEIEVALGKHPEVKESVVVARNDGAEKSLVAYLVVRGLDASPDSIRDFLRRSLPGHMIPATFILLDALPLTPAGKIDRRALPAPGVVPQPDLTPPRTLVEKELASIWSAVLHCELVGLQSDFFQLGGHSLLAIQVLSRVRACFGVEVPLRRFFDSTTLAGFAAVIEDYRQGSSRPPAPVIERMPRQASRLTQTPEGVLERAPGG